MRGWSPSTHRAKLEAGEPPQPRTWDGLWPRGGGCGGPAGAWTLSWRCGTSAKGSGDGEASAVTMETVLAVFLLGGQNRNQGWKGRTQCNSVCPGLDRVPGTGGEQATADGYALGRAPNGGGFEDLRGSFQAQRFSNARPPGQLRPRAAAFRSPVPSSVLTPLQHLEAGELACMALSPLGLAAASPLCRATHRPCVLRLPQPEAPPPPPGETKSLSSQEQPRERGEEQGPTLPALPARGPPSATFRTPCRPLNQSNHISI